GLAQIALINGEGTQATNMLSECLSISREKATSWGMGVVLTTLSLAAIAEGDHASAARLAREGLNLRWLLQDRRGVVDSMGAVAFVTSAQGRLPQAARLLGAADALCETIGVVPPPASKALQSQTEA